MTIFYNFSPPSNHPHPLQVENCDSNSRLVVDEDDNVELGLKGLTSRQPWRLTCRVERRSGHRVGVWTVT